MTDERLEGPTVIQFGDFKLNRRLRRLERNAEIVKLATKPLEVLEFLVTHHDQPVSKGELLKAIWGNRDLDPNLVEQAIRQIRVAVEVNPREPLFIVTVPGSRYRFAVPVVIDEWVEAAGDVGSAAAMDPQGSPSDGARLWRSPWVYAATGLLSLLGVGIVLYFNAPGEPAACEVSVNTLIVKDGQGREVWRREFSEGFSRERYASQMPFCEYVDLDGDGTKDVLFSLKRQSYLLQGDTLYGFVTRSRMLRRLWPTPARALKFEPGASLVVGPNSDATIARPYDEYLPPYVIAGVFPRNAGDGKTRIVVSSVTNYAPNQIAVLDSDFKEISEYWHTGHLKFGQFAQYNGQDRIFLGGVNNGYRSATLIAFDPNNIKGTSDLSADLPDRVPGFAVLGKGSRGHLSPLGAGTETCRVFFERTCVAKAKPYREPYNRVIGFTVNEDRIFVTVAEGEREDTPATVSYEMDRHLNLVEALPNTKFRQRHMELERAGLLDHSFSPQELKPLIHVLPGCEFVEKRK